MLRLNPRIPAAGSSPLSTRSQNLVHEVQTSMREAKQALQPFSGRDAQLALRALHRAESALSPLLNHSRQHRVSHDVARAVQQDIRDLNIQARHQLRMSALFNLNTRLDAIQTPAPTELSSPNRPQELRAHALNLGQLEALRRQAVGVLRGFQSKSMNDNQRQEFRNAVRSFFDRLRARGNVSLDRLHLIGYQEVRTGRGGHQALVLNASGVAQIRRQPVADGSAVFGAVVESRAARVAVREVLVRNPLPNGVAVERQEQSSTETRVEYQVTDRGLASLIQNSPSDKVRVDSNNGNVFVDNTAIIHRLDILRNRFDASSARIGGCGRDEARLRLTQVLQNQNSMAYGYVFNGVNVTSEFVEQETGR